MEFSTVAFGFISRSWGPLLDTREGFELLFELLMVLLLLLLLLVVVVAVVLLLLLLTDEGSALRARERAEDICSKSFVV